jgi:tRNA (guanine-N7-)-methyltransferase
MRLRKVKYALEMLMSHPEIMVLNPENNKGKWNALFPSVQPIHLEIGMGKGKFLFEQAKMNPTINYVGIEKYDSVIVRALEKLLADPLPNVLLVYVDAERLPDLFTKNEISHLYLNFSDPWPKNAHKKRRLTSPLFLTRYLSILKNDAVVEYKTDNFEFFEYSMLTLVEYGTKIQKISLNLQTDADFLNIETEFESRFAAMGNPIYYIRFIIEEPAKC